MVRAKHKNGVDVLGLAKAKLASSGLTTKIAKALGIKILTAKATSELYPRAPLAPSLQLVYHDAAHKPRPDIYRLRVLAPPKGDFGTERTDIRYLQPPGTPPAAYFPAVTDWPAVLANPQAPIVITEGELKAACACAHGFSCIGLGGVSAWRSKKRGWSFLPELQAIDWTQRYVTICYDSDLAVNRDVQAATGGLVGELTRRGARVGVAFLPELEGAPKTGLDDFLVSEGSDALRDVLNAAEMDELGIKLWQFNESYTVIITPPIVWDERTDQIYKSSDFREHVAANVMATSTTDGGMVKTRVAPAWVRWEHRSQLDGITYAPGRPTVTDNMRNSWKGWGCEEAKGSIDPWKQLMALLFEGAPAEERRWFERWCFYPIAHPGAKLLSATSIWSHRQGVGKSLVGETLTKVYGKNASTISQRELENDFNSWATNKQFVMVDDVSGHDSRSKADLFKKLITQTVLNVNEKFVPRYTLPDTINYYITSNQPNALYLEDHDRRFFVHEATAAKREAGFYDAYHRWLDNGGAGHLLYHARRHDFGDFDPHLPPPWTEAKRDMVGAVKGELDSWIAGLREDPGPHLRIGRMQLERDIYTSQELLSFFDAVRAGPPTTSTTMGLKLRNYFPRVPIKTHGRIRVDGRIERLYAVRNVDKWAKATTKMIAKHVSDGRAKERGRTEIKEPKY